MFGQSSTSPWVKSFSKFDRLYLCSPLTYIPYITCIERSKPPVIYVTAFQETGSILRVSFSLSKWPHFHRVYLVIVCRVLITTVGTKKYVPNFKIFPFFSKRLQKYWGLYEFIMVEILKHPSESLFRLIHSLSTSVMTVVKFYSQEGEIL